MVKSAALGVRKIRRFRGNSVPSEPIPRRGIALIKTNKTGRFEVGFVVEHTIPCQRNRLPRERGTFVWS